MDRCNKTAPWGSKRTVETEAYFTSAALARECVAFLESFAPLGQFSYILEPSAGAGAFIRALAGRKVVGLDLEPRAEGIERGDFFCFEPPCFEPNILVVGNPPFGQRGALAIRFLQHAMNFAGTVAFILPRSFKKHTFLNRVDRSFHLLGQFDCSDFVLPDGMPIEVKCVFQVWQKKNEPRPLNELPATHAHFDMKHFHLSRTSREVFERAAHDYDFAIAQVGSNFAPKNIRALSAGSYWFIKAKEPGVAQTFCRLNFDFLDGLNTAHKSLSKKDIVAAYAEAIAERGA